MLAIEELTEFKKPIRFCEVEVGPAHGHPDTPGKRGIICGATNFAVGDLVPVALPGATLPGGFAIGSRKTYGRVSDGMICSERELGLGAEHDGIMVLPADAGEPGEDAGPLLGIAEEVLDIAVTPDRGYALSIRGVAREAAVAYGVAFDDPGTDLAELPAPEEGPVVECRSEDLGASDLFTLRTMVDFDPHAPSPLWLRSRLIACGMRPVSLAVDITNYVMLETGQPLHAFDADLLRGPVRPRRAPPGRSWRPWTTSSGRWTPTTSSSPTTPVPSAWPAPSAGSPARSTTTPATSRWKPPTSPPTWSPAWPAVTRCPPRRPAGSSAAWTGSCRCMRRHGPPSCCCGWEAGATSG